MSLEALALGTLALRGLGELTRLIRGMRDSEVSERLSSGDPLSQAEFEVLLDRILEIARGTGDEGAAAEAEGLIGALTEDDETLSPMLFEMLDADGSGEIDGEELLSLQRLVSHLQRGLPESTVDRMAAECRLAT
ncbi:hypothetical protein JXA47_08980 [Candidatus Sumerlaeota bacterium]|nr:hypothetical protein [Candidatus Sumerlaeota bacterium]